MRLQQLLESMLRLAGCLVRSRALLVLAAAFLCGSQSFAQTGRLKSFNNPAGPETMGVNIHFTDPSAGEMEQIAAAGFRWVRMDFAWGGIEREKGRYDFSAYDRLVASLKRFKMRGIFILDYGNDLYEKGSPRSDEAIQAFARFSAAAVTHFRGNGIFWEMWNEPNGGFWSPRANVDEYIKLALATGKAIRAAAPNEIYIGPATSGMDFGFIEPCFKAGLLQYWDAVSFHPYRNSPPETAAADFNHIKSMIEQYAPRGKSVPIISGEWGYSELYPGLSKELQSRYISREFLTNMANGLIVSIWYDWHDDGPDPKEPEHHFGTVYADYAPKETYIAAKTLAAALSGYHYNKRLALANPNDYCLLFSKPDGSVLVAAWTTERDKHQVTLPASTGEFQTVTNLGERSKLHADNAGIHTELSGAPVYLVPLHKNDLLTLAASWKTMPKQLNSDSQAEVASALSSYWVRGAIAAPYSQSIVVSVENPSPGSTGTSQRTRWSTSSRAVPLRPEDLIWEQRRAGGTRYRVSIKLPNSAELSQEIQIYARHPLTLVASPAHGTVLPVTVENPTGAAIHGAVVLGTGSKAKSVPVAFSEGETRQVVALPIELKSDSRYTVQLSFQEAGHVTLRSPAVEYVPYDSFSGYSGRSELRASEYVVAPDGDAKVSSSIQSTVELAPAGLPGTSQMALHISYSFDRGWKFLRVAPQGARHESLSGAPTGIGMWLYGDGSGDILNLRYVDKTGQTFQTSAGSIDWKGWHFVSFSLSPENASHWGGADNGIIAYPISVDTIALIDSPGGRGGTGNAWITDITIMSEVEKSH